MLEVDQRVRSERKELPGSSTSSSQIMLLDVQFGQGEWRIVEAFSKEGKPLELEVRWSATTASGPWVKVTVAHATRLCVFAKSVTLYATNLSTDSNTVIAQVADGFTQTANVWEHRAKTDGSSALHIPVPPFAVVFHLHLAERGALPAAIITVFDGAGTARARFSAANQPAGGIPVGGAGRIEITTEGSIDLRGIFTLLL